MSFINSVCWYIATFFLISSGLFYTFKLKFVQFDFKNIFKSIRKKEVNASITPFMTLTLALAARIGVGSLAGIALSIYYGGRGTLFWIWLSTIITIPNSFVESVLAIIYHQKKGNYYNGGPAYYIKKGLGFRKLAFFYSFIIAICYLGGFLAIQANTIAVSLNNYLNIPLILSGIILSLITYLVIVKGLKRITQFTSFLVPVMGIIYLTITLIIIVSNINKVPSILLSIFYEAFNIKSLGWGIFSSIIIGIQRGIFSSEAGIGTGAIASGISNSKNPIDQGYLQMFGIYFTSFIICTSTAFIILTSNINIDSFNNPNGIEITLFALNNHLGNYGTIVFLLIVLSFAFSTIISGYYYGGSNLEYMGLNIKKKIINIIVVIILLIGSIMPPTKLWCIVDIGVAILAVINSLSIFLLNGDIDKVYKKGSGKYDRQ